MNLFLENFRVADHPLTTLVRSLAILSGAPFCEHDTMEPISMPRAVGGTNDYATPDRSRYAALDAAALQPLAVLSGRLPASCVCDQHQALTDQQIDRMRKDIQSQKRQVIAANMILTDEKAEQFWPIFDQYNGELIQINNNKYAAIKEFARSYDNLTGEQAEN